MNIKNLLFQLIFQSLMGVICLSQSPAADRVLVVHSYHAEFEWVHDINAVLTDQLTTADIPYRIFYMDTKRKPDGSSKLEAARKARQLIEQSVSHVDWVSDDSATANLVLKRVRRRSESGQLPIPITTYLQPVTFEQWKAAIRQCDADANIDALLIPLYHTVKTDAGDKSVPSADVMHWTVNNAHKPVVGLWPFSAHDGTVCAVVVDPKERGKVAALMAKQILAGKKGGDLPMVKNKDGFVIINTVAAEKLGIEVPFEVLLSADEIIEKCRWGAL